jgi:hypothetical protein
MPKEAHTKAAEHHETAANGGGTSWQGRSHERTRGIREGTNAFEDCA